MRYRLVGYDRDWHDLEDVTRRSVNYTNLPPGDYTFEVMAANNAGVWNPGMARFAFSIRHYFQETTLFRALLATLLAMLIYAGYRRQRHVHATQRRLLERQVLDRTQELHAANERLQNVSQTDPLTGLRNRRYLDNQIPADLAFYDREQLRTGNYDQVILFALVDIDHFKTINDTYGHKAGDRVLQQVAQVLTALVRGGDYIARWGGEEFLLVFRPMPHRFVEVIGERTRAAIANHVFDLGDGTTQRLTCSVGIAEYPLFRNAQRRFGWEQMIELADGALYWRKQHGRDGWAAFRPTALTDLATLMRDLHSAPQKLIDQGQLQLLGSHLPPQ
jgi:diguanylate cyclase (GGDEF)-like protein